MPPQTPSYRRIAALVATAAFYIFTARAGLLLEPVGGFATFVWAPTGIAIAAALLLGIRPAVWATIFVAAFVSNVSAGAHVGTALAIGVGNTLEAMVAAWGLRRVGFNAAFDRLRDSYVFMLAAAAAPIVSATIGVTSLVASGTITGAEAGLAWQAWWTGDFIGALVVAPFILAWVSHRRAFSAREVGEFLAMLVALAIVGGLVFLARPADTTFLRPYLVLPVLLWASVRFEQRGATAAGVLTALIAIMGTATGAGPFARPQVPMAFLELQTFMGVTAATFLVLSTALGERAQAQRMLADANKAKSDFLATMSHELRTPLNAIVGYAELLEMGVHGELAPGQRDSLARIRRSERRLRALIDDVLNFARIEAGRLVLSPRAMNVRDAITEAGSVIAPQLRGRQLQLVIDCDAGLVAWADFEKVHQILLNLLANAVKFTPDPGTIRVSADATDDGVAIHVQDTGVGIPEDRQHHIFEPFVQLGRSLASPQDGTGLGLAISRDLARAMQGGLSVQSAPGHGSTFTLVLPGVPRP